MADRVFSVTSFTLEAVAATTTYAANKFMALKGGSSTQLTRIKEVRLWGLEASASSPLIILLARDSTVCITPTALSAGTEHDAWRHPASADLAAPVVTFTNASTRPQRSSTLVLAHLAYNALGGGTKERFAEGYEPTILGNTASLGEASVSGMTGSSLVALGGHIVYETY